MSSDSRISWAKIYMDFALSLAERSTCKRASVGSVITSWDHTRVLAVGYNGNYKGGPNTCDSDQEGKCGCLHSETNCCIKLDYNDPCDKRIYVTMSPCVACAKTLIQAGIEEVIYYNCYRDQTGLDLLSNCGITTIYYPFINNV